MSRITPASFAPPPPAGSADFNSPVWQKWFQSLYSRLSSAIISVNNEYVFSNGSVAGPFPMYSYEQLQTDLNTGIGGILATAGNAYYLSVSYANAEIIIADKKAAYNTTITPDGAAHSAIALTAGGLAMGYNDTTTGAWHDAISIDSTGTVVIGGALYAASGSFVAGITIGANGSLSSGQTAFNTGTGYWLEYNGGTPRLSIGNATTGSSLVWDGTNLTVGNNTIAGTSGKTIYQIATSTGYSKTQLEIDLASGVSSVVATTNSGTGQQYVLDVNATAAAITIGAVGAVYNGTAGAGAVRPLIGMAAGGLAMGYNDAAGTWHNSVAIDSSGNATFSGALSAASGSFVGAVTAGATVTGNLIVGTAGAISSGQTAFNTGTGYWLEYNGGTPRLSIGNATTGSSLVWDGTNLTIGNSALMNGSTVATVVNNASTGAAAYNLASTALQAGTTYVLGGQQQITGTGGVVAGNITWNTSNGVITGGSGIAITQNGLIGAQNGVSTFSITNAGVATFSGNLIGGANINITGAAIINGNANGGGGNAALSANYYGSSTVGIWAYSGTNSGIIGEGTVSNAIGVCGVSNLVGGIGVVAESYSGTALQVDGLMTISNSTLVSNLNAQFWNGVSFNTSTTGSALATFATANKPGSASSNTWLPVTNLSGGIIGYLPFWT